MIGQVLSNLRNKRGLTQDQVANALGVKRARYNAWENDIAKPDIDMLKKIAQFYNVSTDYLLGIETVETIAAHRTDDPTEQLPEDAKKSLEEFKQFLLKKHGIIKE